MFDVQHASRPFSSSRDLHSSSINPYDNKIFIVKPMSSSGGGIGTTTITGGIQDIVTEGMSVAECDRQVVLAH